MALDALRTRQDASTSSDVAALAPPPSSASTRPVGAATLLGAGRCLVVSAAELERSRRERLVEVERRREDATVEPTADEHVDQGGLDALDLASVACGPGGCRFTYRPRRGRRITEATS